MKCANCGAELKVGCIYCSICGKEAQIVPDYNLLDDELLKPLIEEETTQNEIKQRKSKKSKQDTPVKKKTEKKKEKKSWKKIACVLSLCGAAIIVLGVFAVHMSRNNSYDYQYETGYARLRSNDYSEAVSYLNKAIELNEESVEANLALAQAYVLMEDTTRAVAAYEQALSLDEECKEAFAGLVEIYEADKDYAAIETLMEQASEELRLDVFADYIVDVPEIDHPGDAYEDDLTIHISADDNLPIYYTVDGSSPIEKGTLYEEPIVLTQGTHVLQAVCKDERGIYSEIVSEEFEIAYSEPDMPTVSPDSGNFVAEQLITVHVPEGGFAFYTWDKTVPTTASTPYTEPISVIPGNNVLSVIIIDKHGNVSPVFRGNYVYMP